MLKFIGDYWFPIFMLLIVTSVTIAALISNDECPREIRGYNCRGSACNHDPEEVRQAKIDMRSL